MGSWPRSARDGLGKLQLSIESNEQSLLGSPPWPLFEADSQQAALSPGRWSQRIALLPNPSKIPDFPSESFILFY